MINDLNQYFNLRICEINYYVIYNYAIKILVILELFVDFQMQEIILI